MQSHLFTKSRLVAGISVVAVIVSCGGSAASGAPGTPVPTSAPAGSVGAAGATATAAPARTRRGSANHITSEEIMAGNFRDAFDIVERLRPQLLLGRGAGNPTESTGSGTIAVAYQDNVPLGALSNLRQIPAVNVKEIRYLNASDATTRWGTGHMGGVILVITKGR